MKKILSILVLTFVTVSFAQNSIEKKLGEFKEIKAFDLINITMIKSKENKIVISGKNKRDVSIVNKNGKLKIRMELREYYDGNETEVTLYYTDVDTIDANEGATITVKDTLDKYDISFKTQEGGQITANIKSTYTDVRAVTGGIINLNGTSKNLDISIYTGGEFYGKKLITETTEVSINAAGEAQVHATEFVEARVRAGGEVLIYGKPKEIDEKTLLGGRVKRM